MTLDFTFVDTNSAKRVLGMKDLSSSDLKTLYKTEGERVFTKFTKMLRVDKAGDLVTIKRKFSGVDCTIYYAPKDPNHDLKMKTIEQCFKQASPGFSGNFGFPNNKLNIYFISSWNGTYFSNASVGNVRIDPKDNSETLTANLILGDGVADATGIVASQVEDYYKKTFTVDSKAKKAMTVVFHELGHIYHQLQNPAHYYGMLDVFACAMAGKLKFSSNAAYANLENSPSWSDIENWTNSFKDVAKQISSYAGSHGCEYVAEVFSALMMGAPMSKEVLALYKIIGGPSPTTKMVHVRTGQGWFKKNVLYPIADQFRDVGDH